ncbi:ABC transporter substrate-binding protein [Sphingomonas oligophenolica]|uniref:ABC transporter substrate-binding protein n=1 Tax=Sphingomonas oligophenolica TaxID=301154 RepID=A0A502CJ87_9SPHN|nr:ABC transporter substrate-binding protein [Sphingomonas oligophenolica]TPG12998.1 ABC transporter substrate-binding protein [Sphingomonas oligophenolica]
MRPALPLLLLVASCAAPPRQGGIVSTNPCADAILAQLAPDRLAAVSHYSHDAAATSMPLALARRFPATAGTAEEVIARAPDLVVTDSFAPAATRAAYARAGLRVLTLGSVATIAASEAQVMEIADAVGRPERGRAMVAEIEAAVDASVPRRRPGSSLGALRRSRSRASTGSALDPGLRRGTVKTNPSALLYIAGDLANGSGTLLDDLLAHAGFRNAAADYGLAYTGTLPIETIAAHPPAVILSPGDGRTAELRRRVLARSHAATREAYFPRQLMNCGGSSIAPALARLAAVRRGL